MDTAQMLGWKVAHFRPMFDAKRKRWRTPASRDGVGFPDLVLVRDRVIVAELKTLRKVMRRLHRMAADSPADQRAAQAEMRRRKAAGLWTL